MDPYIIVIQFESLFKVLSGITLLLLIISYFSYLKVNRKLKERIVKLDQLINQYENKN